MRSRLTLTSSSSPSARSLRLDLPKFTIIDATTRAGALGAPLRDRFGMTHRLEFYTPEEIARIIKKFKAEEVSLELVFFNTNAKTALNVGQTLGVVKLAAAKSNVPLFEYTPLQVKMALTGYGRAEKSQVAKMVQQTFKLKTVPKPDDAADAVAIALTHCYSRRSKGQP